MPQQPRRLKADRNQRATLPLRNQRIRINRVADMSLQTPPTQQLPNTPNTSLGTPDFSNPPSQNPLSVNDTPVYTPVAGEGTVVAPPMAESPTLLTAISPPGMGGSTSGGLSGADFGAGSVGVGDAAAGAGDAAGALGGMDIGDFASFIA